MGFVYKNVPAFNLANGDVLAFDLGAVNGGDFQAAFAMAATTTNGGDHPSTAFTAVVSNTQVPANPRGETTIGNFELQFKVEAPSSFPATAWSFASPAQAAPSPWMRPAAT
jgi:hypothetical protein